MMASTLEARLDDEGTFYLPHSAVFRPEHDSTKTRVVFDGSAKDMNGTSLNDILLSGPALQPDIVQVLLRFRLHRVALIGDISKMFQQIWLQEKDRDMVRVLWM